MTRTSRLRTALHRPRTGLAPRAGEVVSVYGEIDYLTADQLRRRTEPTPYTSGASPWI